MLKLGKREAKFDKRTIKLSSILKVPELPPLPDRWEFSAQFPQFDLAPKMWANDELGDCVYVASVAEQRDFEVIEQGVVIPIDEEQLKADYLKEAGGDYGLVMLDHLKRWRSEGLPIGKRKKFLCLPIGFSKYSIYAFASIDPGDDREMKYATYLLGCNIGATMPDSFNDQFESGHPWDDTSLPPNYRNGHAMKVRGWVPEGLLLWTWGKLQLASWGWCHKYIDEAYAIVDNKNEFMKDSPLDVEKLAGFLEALESV